MKNKRKINLFLAGIISIILLTSTITVVNSQIISENETDKSMKIRIYDTESNSINEFCINEEIYSNLFGESNGFGNDLSLKNIIEYKINILVENGIISENKANQLLNNFNIFEKYNDINQRTLIGNFDVLNLFNGIYFNLDGEIVNSILDLYVLNLPLLNKNISALFSGLTAIEGNGYIFSLGVFGFQYIFNSSLLQDPRFSEIKGSLIGFTGIMIESINGDVDNSNILGIGMNILTYWNEL